MTVKLWCESAGCSFVERRKRKLANAPELLKFRAGLE
jgi:hypothetical protein